MLLSASFALWDCELASEASTIGAYKSHPRSIKVPTVADSCHNNPTCVCLLYGVNDGRGSHNPSTSLAWPCQSYGIKWDTKTATVWRTSKEKTHTWTKEKMVRRGEIRS